MSIDQDASQAFDTEMLDESHPAHVSGQVVNLHGPLDSPDGVLLFAQIHREAFHTRHALIPLRQGFAVDGADPPVPQFVEVTGKGARDEASCTSDDDEIVLVQVPTDLQLRFRSHFEIPQNRTRDSPDRGG